MPKILYDKINNSFKQYPRSDDEPVVGLDTQIYDIYDIVDESINIITTTEYNELLNSGNEIDLNSFLQYDPETQKIINNIIVDHENKRQVLTKSVVDLTEEELQEKYISNLDWIAFEKRLTDNISENNPYYALFNMNDITIVRLQAVLANIVTVTKNIERLKFLLSNVKNVFRNSEFNFTTEQEQELEDCLDILGANFNWHDL